MGLIYVILFEILFQLNTAEDGVDMAALRAELSGRVDGTEIQEFATVGIQNCPDIEEFDVSGSL